MKKTFPPLLIITAIYGLVCCGKQEEQLIIEEKEKNVDSSLVWSGYYENDSTNNNSDSQTGDLSHPFCVSNILTGQVLSDGQTYYTTGYVVGCVSNSLRTGLCLNLPAKTASNIVIADSKDETDYSQCIVVELKSGEIRKSFNLIDNQEIYHRRIIILGQIEKYYNQPGIKNVKYIGLM